MRFETYIHKSNGFVEIVVRDTTEQLHKSGAMLLRSQSTYEEDGGKLVWKNAAYPQIVWHNMKDLNGGFKIAESDTLALLDANISWKILNNIWDNKQ